MTSELSRILLLAREGQALSLKEQQMLADAYERTRAVREWLTPTELAARFGVARRTVYNWMESGRIEVRIGPGGRPRIAADSVLKAAEATAAWKEARRA